MICHYCNETKDTRPYGPNSAHVCFQCAFATDERTKIVEDNFASILNNNTGPMILVEEIGPVPLVGDVDA